MIQKTASARFYEMVDAELEKLSAPRGAGAIAAHEGAVAAAAARNAARSAPKPTLEGIRRKETVKSLREAKEHVRSVKGDSGFLPGFGQALPVERLKARLEKNVSARRAAASEAASKPTLSDRAGSAVLDVSLKAHKAVGDVQHAATSAASKAIKPVGAAASKVLGKVDNAYTAAGQGMYKAVENVASGAGKMKDVLVRKVQASRAAAAESSRASAERYAETARSQRNAPQAAATPKPEPRRATAGTTPWGHIAAAGGVGLVAANAMKNNDE